MDDFTQVKNCTLPVEYAVPDGITKLSFYNVVFASWPILPASLKELHVDTCKILEESEMIFPDGLEVLHLGFQSSLPTSFPPSLRKLHLRKLHFHMLPQLPDSLTHLTLIRGSITIHPAALPPNLEYLSLDGGNWMVLPPFPASLRCVRLSELYLMELPLVAAGVDFQMADVELLEGWDNEGPAEEE